MPQCFLEEKGEHKSNSHQGRKDRQLFPCPEDHGHHRKKSDEDDDPHHSVSQEGWGFQTLELQLILEVRDGLDHRVDRTNPPTVEAGEDQREKGGSHENGHPYLYLSTHHQEGEEDEEEDLDDALDYSFHAFCTLYTLG